MTAVIFRHDHSYGSAVVERHDDGSITLREEWDGEDGPVLTCVPFPLVNLTPHTVSLQTEAGLLPIPPSGTIARAAEKREVVGVYTLSGSGIEIPLTRVTYGDITGLPDPEPAASYIVSRLVAAACPDRDDLLIPDDTVRNEAGQIVGCRALARL